MRIEWRTPTDQKIPRLRETGKIVKINYPEKILNSNGADIVKILYDTDK